ncbi:MAG TPA: hypothetical protein VML55_22690 [Planctomycetaceae bacterium]|nr:hypothetical protein [Planctomycetaceae bacterium]
MGLIVATGASPRFETASSALCDLSNQLISAPNSGHVKDVGLSLEEEQVGRSSMKADRMTVALLTAAVALFAGGVFLSILLLPAAGLPLLMAMRRGEPSARILLTAAWILTLLAVGGVVLLVWHWGELEYGVLGYLVLWGPFIAAACAVGLFVAHFRNRTAA